MDQNYSIVLSRPCQVYKTCMVLICVKGSTHSTNCIDCFRQPRFPTIRSNRHQSNGHWTPDRSCRNSQFFSFGLMYDFQTHCAQITGHKKRRPNPRFKRRFKAFAADFADSMASSYFCRIGWMPRLQVEMSGLCKG